VSTPQLPLSLRSPPDQRLASFIGDTAVRDAVAAAAALHLPLRVVMDRAQASAAATLA
jgi:hypothetical protein